MAQRCLGVDLLHYGESLAQPRSFLDSVVDGQIDLKPCVRCVLE
jgi:hypothetical protein